MSRYEEQRARGADPDAALGAALAGIWRGTLVASISASAAYASLMVTSFRGFYQFGVMGAVGSLACWAATFTALPALLVLLDRRPRRLSARARPPIEFSPLARLLARRSGTVTARLHAAGDRRRLRVAPLPQGPLRVRLQQALRQAQDDRRGEAVQPQRRQAVRPLAVADDRARRQRRRGGADQADDPQAGSRLPRPGRHRPGGDDLGSAPRGRPRCRSASSRSSRRSTS